MQLLDTLAIVGEVLSWIGLGVGLPLLAVAVMIRLVEGDWLPVEVAVVERDGQFIVRWFAGGDFHERMLRRTESSTSDDGWADGFVSANDPSRVRVGEPPHLRRVLRTVGIVFVAVGILGLIISLLPLFV